MNRAVVASRRDRNSGFPELPGVRLALIARTENAFGVSGTRSSLRPSPRRQGLWFGSSSRNGGKTFIGCLRWTGNGLGRGLVPFRAPVTHYLSGSGPPFVGPTTG